MKPFNFGRDQQLAALPDWISRRIEVNRYESYRLLEEAREQTVAGARVLDAGAGEGQYRPYFEHTRYVGLDLAVGDVGWDYSSLDVLGDLRALPFPDAAYDAAVCIQTLEHVNEPMRVINEIGRILKPGGRLYLSAPMSWHQHQKPHDYFRYTSFGFRYLLENSDMRVVEMRPMGGYFWFLSFNLQLFHFWLFPKPRTRTRQLLQMPFKLATQFIFFLVVPLIFFYMDRLDKVKDHTMGWVCIAEKQGNRKAK
ncbi:MAG TPA: class I SAM-dependent methyltransferase [Candidatus Sulfomarinibacteraceae bacterium]|nr:class I SAM-dependent methyltransferase [Candidatus Sulfomarinibacteraceae bacterium]